MASLDDFALEISKMIEKSLSFDKEMEERIKEAIKNGADKT